MSIPPQFPLLDDSEEVIMGSDCLLYSSSDLFVCYMVSVVDAKNLPVASHLCCKDFSLEICVECPSFAGIQKD